MARKTNKKTGASAPNIGFEAKLWVAAADISLGSDYPASHSRANSELHRVAWSGQ